jgi:hypothetical protein
VDVQVVAHDRRLGVGHQAYKAKSGQNLAKEVNGDVLTANDPEKGA